MEKEINKETDILKFVFNILDEGKKGDVLTDTLMQICSNKLKDNKENTESTLTPRDENSGVTNKDDRTKTNKQPEIGDIVKIINELFQGLTGEVVDTCKGMNFAVVKVVDSKNVENGLRVDLDELEIIESKKDKEEREADANRLRLEKLTQAQEEKKQLMKEYHKFQDVLSNIKNKLISVDKKICNLSKEEK